MPPLRTCLGPLRLSNIQAFPGNRFRSGLGVGMSKETKKLPQFVYKPGVGLIQVGCCEPPAPPPPPVVINTYDGGSPGGSGAGIIFGGVPSGSGAGIVNGGIP
jgi:hypothetical protein